VRKYSQGAQGAQGAQVNERISSLESTMEGFHEELSQVRTTLKEIQTSLNAKQTTNWSVIVSVIGLVIALYLAEIRPLHADSERHDREQQIIATAVLEKDVKINSSLVAIAAIERDVLLSHAEINDIRDKGSPTTAARLGIIEKQVNEIYESGSRNTDKRISMIEYRLGITNGASK
jgi:hypothetical protein